MALKIQHSKIRVKRSSVPGTKPTIGPSSDHTDNTWSNTDIYPGEFFINTVDKKLWIGTENDILSITTTDSYFYEIYKETTDVAAITIFQLKPDELPLVNSDFVAIMDVKIVGKCVDTSEWLMVDETYYTTFLGGIYDIQGTTTHFNSKNFITATHFVSNTSTSIDIQIRGEDLKTIQWRIFINVRYV